MLKIKVIRAGSECKVNRNNLSFDKNTRTPYKYADYFIVEFGGRRMGIKYDQQEAITLAHSLREKIESTGLHAEINYVDLSSEYDDATQDD